MKNLLFVLLLSSCKLSEIIGGGSSSSSSSSSAKPVCVQQTNPKSPDSTCKPGDWYVVGKAGCSSTKERCESK